MAINWPVLSLREAGVALIDCEHRTPPAAPSGYPYVAIPQMKQGRLDLSDARQITAEHFAEWTRKARPRSNDVILSRRCNPGETVVVPDGLDCALGQNLVLLRSDGTMVHPPFLRWLVRGPEWWNQIGTFLNAGAIFDSLKCADVPNFRLSIPPLPEQRAIAVVLGALDDKIELNRKQARVLEGISRAVFTSWFVNFDPVRRPPTTAAGDPPHHHGLPPDHAALLPKRLVDSPVGEVPEGWRVGTLGELGALAIGGDWGEDEPFAGATEAYCLRGVDLEHLRSTGQATPPRRWMKQSSIDRRTMDERDVLVAGSGAGPTGRPLWVCPGFMRTNTPVIYSNFCKRIRCRSAGAAVYLDAWLHRMRESGEIWEHVNGTSVPNLDANSLLAGKAVVIPPEPLLQKYYMLVRPMWERLFCGENRTLAALRDALLPTLISGELRIADAERIAGRAV